MYRTHLPANIGNTGASMQPRSAVPVEHSFNSEAVSNNVSLPSTVTNTGG